ncbi:hypothetical protein [Polaromonas sp. CG_9.11]|uniref:hypothetical protein n=1 Tax=Polaromonas sp. CG_9.11 TaxID=2787730 RepID=UPI0018CA2A71|nr:hypothetical protein [Polaromonas sp. CG_9.11]MBG6074567.1 hypothetical protein [Polaromonas sp. CG_9.11]
MQSRKHGRGEGFWEPLHRGAQVYFTALNANGDVEGRPVEMSPVVEGYDVPRARVNVKSSIAGRSSFAPFNWHGTRMVEARTLTETAVATARNHSSDVAAADGGARWPLYPIKAPAPPGTPD